MVHGMAWHDTDYLFDFVFFCVRAVMSFTRFMSHYSTRTTTIKRTVRPGPVYRHNGAFLPTTWAAKSEHYWWPALCVTSTRSAMSGRRAAFLTGNLPCMYNSSHVYEYMSMNMNTLPSEPRLTHVSLNSFFMPTLSHALVVSQPGSGTCLSPVGFSRF